MASHIPVTERVLGAVKHTPWCDLDTLAKSLPELTWNQVFFEIDRLSRLGEVVVTFGPGGSYMIRLPRAKKSASAQHD